MSRLSMRARLTWAFLGVAGVVLALVIIGFNVGIYLQSERLGTGMGMGAQMGGGRGMGMGQGQGQGQGQGAGGGNAPRYGLQMNREGRLQVMRWSIMVGAGGLLFAPVMGYFVAERITRPLSRLAKDASAAGPEAGSFIASPDDVPEVQALATALNQMTQRIQADDAMRRDLFADVAHELRHPIALIRGRLEMMVDGITPVTPESLSALQDEVIRLGRLVADVRELSLADVGTLSLNLQPTDLGEIIAITQENFEPVASGREIALKVAAGPLPAIQADPDRIRQILTNLLSNAMRHTPEGGQISLRAARVDGLIQVAVADTGSGIPEADLPHIFDRFYRADKSRNRSTGGTGLGLAISRSLARLHGGDLVAENGPQGGAVFTLTLPITGGGSVPS